MWTFYSSGAAGVSWQGDCIVGGLLGAAFTGPSAEGPQTVLMEPWNPVLTTWHAERAALPKGSLLAP